MQLFKMFFVVFLLFFSVVRGMSSTTVVNDVKQIIFFKIDDDSQENLGSTNKDLNKYYKNIRKTQIKYLSNLMKFLQENKINEFKTFIEADDICSKYVRTHICTVLGIDNTLENNQCIYQNSKVTNQYFLSSIINTNSLLAAYIYIKQNGDKVAAIIEACKYKRHNIVRLLLGMRVDVNSKDKDGYTVLMWAVWYGNIEIVKLLLATEGIDVNSKDDYGDTALMQAVREGNIEIVTLLLATEGIDVNSKDDYGYTALMQAVWEGNIEIVTLFRQVSVLYWYEKWFIGNVMNFIVTAICLCHFFIINP